MKKSMLALAVSLLATGAWAQVSVTVSPSPAPLPATPSSVLANPAVMNTELPPLATGSNPFTGVTKAQSEIDRNEADLKRLRTLSTQKLALQRDELEALRIELDKKKILDVLNPPKPIPVPVVSPTGGNEKSGSTSNVSSTNKATSESASGKISNTTSTSASTRNRVRTSTTVAAAPVAPPTPPQIIAPAASKFETPQVLGVIDIAGQKVAMVKFDSQTFRVTNGSFIGGKGIAEIEPNGVRWGTSFLKVASSDSNPPSFAVTDQRSDSRSSAPTPMAVQVQPQMQVPSYGPSTPVTLTPTGATRNSPGAIGPSGVLQLPPPPPSMIR